MKSNIVKLGIFFIVIFLILIFYLTYLNLYLGSQLSANPYNLRMAIAEDNIVRGSILDKNGIVLAKDVKTDNEKIRKYPLGENTAHLIGYLSSRYGRSGLEADLNYYLLAMDYEGKLDKKISDFKNEQFYGYDVYLTLDTVLQKKAFELLGDQKGAVVALEPSTGKVLAMVSKPSYDPNLLEDVVEGELTYFDKIGADEANSPLLNRATAGLYPPGSTFKLVTGAGVLKQDLKEVTQSYNCRGQIVVDGFSLSDTGVHGNVELKSALKVSCNSAFAYYGLALGEKGLRQIACDFGFLDKEGNSSILLQQTGLDDGLRKYVQYSPGRFTSESFSKAELASNSIGQGSNLASPMQMALVVQAISNKGTIVVPYVLDYVKDKDGEVKMKNETKAWNKAVSEEDCQELILGMQEVVNSGTGTRARVDGISVAGKTGSAENEKGITHAWFVGFAPVENPKIALSIIVENGGGGGKVAAPIASQLFSTYLKNNQSNNNLAQ